MLELRLDNRGAYDLWGGRYHSVLYNVRLHSCESEAVAKVKQTPGQVHSIRRILHSIYRDLVYLKVVR